MTKKTNEQKLKETNKMLLELVKMQDELSEMEMYLHDMEMQRVWRQEQINEIKKQLKIK